MSRRPAKDTQFGRMQFRKVNMSGWEWRDFYHWLLGLTWKRFAAFVLGVHVTLNLIFALLYWAAPGCIAEMPPASFSDAFFFSEETLATVGYGHFFPATLYGHTVATLEIMTGMFGLAVITGLIFVRFSRPSARLEYSGVMVVGSFKGQPALMFRVGNLRQHAMAEAEFRLMAIRREDTAEEDDIRVFYALPLQLERVALFPAALTIRHLIDEKSPLHGATEAEMKKADYRFMASVVCVDTVIPAPVHSQHVYTWREVRFGERFVEMYNDIDQGTMEVDYGRIGLTEPLPPPR